MANKKSKNQNLLRRILTWIKTNKLKSFLIIIALIFIGGFAYDRYQNWRNVRDMEELLAAFEQLESDLEAETGEDFYIEANCGSVGKFATSYACTVSLNSTEEWKNTYPSVVENYPSDILSNFGDCNLLSSTSIGYEKDKYVCIFKVNTANESRVESIFYEYDKSPGRAF